MLVDSHCHLDRLDLSHYGGDLEAVLTAAAGNGVTHMLCVCIDRGNFEAVRQIAADHDNVYASAGVHPNEQEADEITQDELRAMALHPEVVAIGETGLDYFRSTGDLEWQRARFRRHIAVAREVEKPLIIHSREAGADTLRILAEEGADRVGGVMHCFVDDWQTAQQALDLGFYISFSGIVTFRSAEALRQVAAKVPEDRLLVETDSPYLAPVPHRGKSNYPAYTRLVAETLADIRGSSLEAIAQVTTDNFFRLFGR